MTSDRKKVYLISALTLAALLSCLFITDEITARICAAAVLTVIALSCLYFIKKRAILSINKNLVLVILTVCALLYVVLIYLSGFEFGFIKSRGLTVEKLFGLVIPIIVIIITTEIIRWIILAQKLRTASIIIFIASLMTEVFIYTRLVSLESFLGFMNIFGLHILPAITANILYHYVSKRYGIYPNIAFRLIFTLYSYVFPLTPGIPESLLS